MTELSNAERRATGNGLKFDGGKISMSLLTRGLAKPLYATATVLTYGAAKYAPNNWQGVEPGRYEDALDRHLTSWRAGEDKDPETGIHHLAHAACNVLFLLWGEIKDLTLAEIGKFNPPPTNVSGSYTPCSRPERTFVINGDFNE